MRNGWFKEAYVSYVDGFHDSPYVDMATELIKSVSWPCQFCGSTITTKRAATMEGSLESDLNGPFIATRFQLLGFWKSMPQNTLELLIFLGI